MTKLENKSPYSIKLFWDILPFYGLIRYMNRTMMEAEKEAQGRTINYQAYSDKVINQGFLLADWSIVSSIGILAGIAKGLEAVVSIL